MWKSIALESILYGIEITSMSKADLSTLDSIQGNFGAGLLGVRRTCTHAAIHKELGWLNISSIIMKRKMRYWARLCSLPKSNWVYLALMENMKGSWNSTYRKEILDIHSTYNLGNILEGGSPAFKNIKSKIEKHDQTRSHMSITEKEKHSLRCFPSWIS